MNLTRGTLEKYFKDNWISTSIQYDGTTLDPSSLNDFIALKFIPVINDQYAFDGSADGRVDIVADFQVFCYAKNVPKVFTLADSVISFLSNKNGTHFGIDVNSGYGQVLGSATNLDNGFFEVVVSFKINHFL
jgi:hypothetical protein